MNSFTKNITTISRCAMQFHTDHLAGTGLRGGWHSIITHICRTPGISQEQLSKLIYINKSNIARQLAHLEENGFVTREYSATDKRVLLVYPTEKALALFPVILDIHQSWREYLTDGFTEEELSLLSSLLDRVANRAKEYVDSRESKSSHAAGDPSCQ
ncbi:MAG: MarR family transcriptional regulator [Lachnospiraceae bacterium]|nr:MarR family transcriptional regulator [Lachnospiraceae bacterium]